MEFVRKDNIQITKLSGDVVTSIGGLAPYYDSDWYVNVLLTKSIEMTDYVQISTDSYQFSIDRQNINPYFFELGFFETVQEIGYNQNNVDFWANVVQQNKTIESAALYNILSDLMNESLELKSTVFDIQIQPDPIVDNSVTIIDNKMTEIRTLTEQNQIDFVQSKLTP